MTKKRIGCLIIPATFIIIVVAVVLIHKSHYQDHYTYETSDEIIKLFMENTDDFNDYVERFHENTMWYFYYENNRGFRDDCGNYKALKEFTSKEEYEFLDTFYQKYRPSYWYRLGVQFDTDDGDVKFLKSLEPDSIEFTISKAKSDGFVVDYYDDGWVSITYINKEQ